MGWDTVHPDIKGLKHPEVKMPTKCHLVQVPSPPPNQVATHM